MCTGILCRCNRHVKKAPFYQMIVKVIDADILYAPEQYIAHQCNCVTIHSYGLALSIARKYPAADIYKRRSVPDIPGTITIIPESKTIICMFAQWAPGKPYAFSRFYPFTYHDSGGMRLHWFKACLDNIDKLNLGTVAMPYNIGCGLAGGNWPEYEKLIADAKTPIVLYNKV